MSRKYQHGKIINTPIYNGSGITTNLVIREFPFFSTCEVMGVFDVEFLTVILSAFVITRIDPLVDLVRRVR